MADSRLGQDKNSRTPATTSWSLLSPTTWLPVWLGGTAHPSPAVTVAAKAVGGIIGGNTGGLLPSVGEHKEEINLSADNANPMERLKAELLSYNSTFSSFKKSFTRIHNELILQETSITAPSDEKHIVRSVSSLSTKESKLELARHKIEVLTTALEQKEQPLVEALDELIVDVHDVNEAKLLCEKAIELLNELDIDTINIKGLTQDARDQKSIFLKIFRVLLALARVPDIIPDSINERSDDRLYIAIKPSINKFTEWLEHAKVILIKAEKCADEFLKMKNASSKGTIAPESETAIATNVDSSALVNQRLLASAPVSAEVTNAVTRVNNESAAPAPALMQTREVLERHLSRSPTDEIGGFGYRVEAPISPAHALFHIGSPSSLVGSIPKSPSVLHDGSDFQLDPEEEARVLKHAGLATNYMV